MRAVVFHRRAQRDLDEIYDYIAHRSGSEDAAFRFLVEIQEHLGRLASFRALAGSPRPELGPGLRSTPHGRYTLVLKFDERLLVLVRVVHGARRIDRLRFDEPQRPFEHEVAA